MSVAEAEAATPAKAREPLSDHLKRLEAESIEIIREVAAAFDNPVMLYSIGKDCGVMLHLAAKAFYPGKPPFPLLHVDTTWKFRDMIRHRDTVAERYGVKLLVYTNEEGVRRGINPIDSGSSLHTQVMKTEALKQALDKYGFDAAFGGARRDEEKSRAKERIFSFRSAGHAWDPRNQRPELWRLYNTRINKGESIRVFPLSNWTELDIWEYTARRGHPGGAALFRRAAAGGEARRHADHARRRAHAAPARRDGGDQLGALPLARLLPADRRGRIARRPVSMTSSPRCAPPGPPSAQGRLIDIDEVRLDGEEEARGLLLMDGAQAGLAAATAGSRGRGRRTRACCGS